MRAARVEGGEDTWPSHLGGRFSKTGSPHRVFLWSLSWRPGLSIRTRSLLGLEQRDQLAASSSGRPRAADSKQRRAIGRVQKVAAEERLQIERRTASERTAAVHTTRSSLKSGAVGARISERRVDVDVPFRCLARQIQLSPAPGAHRGRADRRQIDESSAAATIAAVVAVEDLS